MTAAAPLVVRTAGGELIAQHVEQARSFWARFKGLMGRASLEPGTGLYLADSSIHMFFMRFPIDALFVAAPDATGRRRVVAIRPDLPPWRGLVLPVKGAAGVVELPAGSIAAAGVQLGDVVVFEELAAASS